MGKKTPLFDQHEQQGARIVDFGGWDMPVNYGSQIEEHHQVRTDAGMFDVSHMTVVDLAGERVIDFLRKLLTKDVAKLKGPGKAVYTCMLNERGGIIDDLITYYIDDEHFRMVVNAATREKDLAWIRKQAEPFGVEVTERDDTAMVALQGPNAREKAATVLDEAVREEAMGLKLFNFGVFGDLFIARTGYTGEDGWEMILPADKAPEYWQKWLDAGIRPVGLGARDTLRLEAGLNLYGTDMDEDTHPMESGLGWTVAWEPADRDFIGRAALEAAREKGVDRQLVGLVLEGRGVLRSHQPVIVDAEPAGEVTGGTFSPTLNRSIALARVPTDIGERCQVEIRKRRLDAKVVKPPFVRQGEIQVDLD